MTEHRDRMLFPELEPNDDELKQRYLDELSKRLGCSFAACQRVGIKRGKVQRWLEEDKEFAKQVDAIAENALDYVEGKLFEGVGAGNAQLIKFYLENKGRSRGYGKTLDDDENARAPIVLSQDEMEY